MASVDVQRFAAVGYLIDSRTTRRGMPIVSCMKTALLIAICMAGCMVGGAERQSQVAEETGIEDCGHDYDSCSMQDGRDGYCSPEIHTCAVACDELQHFCWSWTYAWPSDPNREHASICYCIDEDPTR